MLDNGVAGIEITENSGAWGEQGPLVKDTLIVGHSDLNSGNNRFCTGTGLKGPRSYFLTISNTTFVNFDRSSCVAFGACSHCGGSQGGFITRYEKLTFINSPNMAKWQWNSEHLHRDLDGSLTGIPGGALVPYSGIQPLDNCTHHQGSSLEYPSSVCDVTISFVRVAVHSVTPSIISTRPLLLTNEHGTTTLPFSRSRLIGSAGLMGLLPENYEYHIRWQNYEHIANISYFLIFNGLKEDDYFLLTRNYSQQVDRVTINGITRPAINTKPNPIVHNTGDWYIDDSFLLTYLVKGRRGGGQFSITYRTLRCYFKDCIVPTPPPTPAPTVSPSDSPDAADNQTQNWSNNTIWSGGQLPKEGDGVYINCTLHVILDVPVTRLANLTICGVLELLDELNHTIEADFILIDGGKLAAGSSAQPFQHIVTFMLHGDKTSPEVILPPFGPTLGTKAIGVFGQLILHGQQRLVIWTHLVQTVLPGFNTIEVVDTPDWRVGEEIVIASTSYEMLHTEKFQILAISGKSITLNGTTRYKHLGEETTIDGHTYTQRAEVGLLTRNIKVQSGNLATTAKQSFGCRIFVSTYSFHGRRVGNAQLYGVEISNCGQLGYIDSFDPRYALAISNIRSITSSEVTYIRRSSIHDSYNSGIGVFGSDNVLITDNVIHVTVGPSLIVQGSGHILEKNMATVALFPGTYPGTEDTKNVEWTANFVLVGTKNVEMIGNAAAGGARIGFHIDGESCDSPVVNGTPRWEGNVAHSTLHGIHVGYSDGVSPCFELSYFTIYSCYHYGIFTYSQSEVYIHNNVLVDNKAAILSNVFAPSSLSHQKSTKKIRIESTIIVGASPYLTAEDDNIIPRISSDPGSSSPMLAPKGGHVGIILSSFLSGAGHFPTAPWPSITSYPALSGLTTLNKVSFINFVMRNSKRDVVFMSNPVSEDCQHPIYVSNITLINTDSNSLYFNHRPSLGSVNPSDCVDLDCDAQKHILIKDLDGTLLNSGPDGTIISQAEFEWDGDPRRGLGDYRIPKVLIADPRNGLPIPVDDLFPLKGIVRGGNRSESNCRWISLWNAYSCTGLDHLMFIFESLDTDTEVQRLSPFALAANGFIDILNGPQDHGWCGGYTCQERISTFFGIIAPGLNYEIALTSTNLQNMRFHLLHAEESDVIRIAFVYTIAQRLDVYYENMFVHPKNVEVDENGELRYNSKDSSLPEDQFIPTLNDAPGSNFYERSVKRLYFILRGNTPITIRTAPVIQLAIHLPPVTVDEFFEENLVFNLATLLGINMSRIKVVNVISEASNIKRQVAETSVEIEIGNPPETTLSNENSTTDETIATDPNALDFDTLENVTSMVAEVIQTGQLEEMLNVSILSADVQPPEAPPEDPTGGVRATPDTGGPQPGEVENGTLTFAEKQSAEQPNETGSITLAIPKDLRLQSQPTSGIEGLSLTPIPILAVYDNNGEVISNLGISDPWVAFISVNNTSQNSVQVVPDTEVMFVGGIANFANASISHPGSGYVLKFNITNPPVGFTVETAPFDVLVREMVIEIFEAPQSGSTAVELSPHPIIELLDEGIMKRVSNIGWRGRRWFAKLVVKTTDGESTGLEWEAKFDNNNATATFSDVLITIPGNYLMRFTAFTNPDSDIIVTGIDHAIKITVYPSAKIGFVIDADFDYVVGSNETSFVASVDNQLSDVLPEVKIYNISVAQGSIVIVFYIQSKHRQNVINAIRIFTNTDITIDYNGHTYFANNKTTEFIGVSEPGDEIHERIIIIIAAGGGTALLLLSCMLAIVSYRCYKRRHSRVWKIHVATSKETRDNTKKYSIREIYWQTPIHAHVEGNDYILSSFLNADEKSEQKDCSNDLMIPNPGI